ncbi:diaminopropionate ammonia-lyase [Bradyrhizobium sp. NAS80.1]|uniref:diaminopropionate ammonia-lyase n=1 Tax=Bradyrhizobium sp. NAS80.1 TaxID=1680159 RepID=UPI00095B7A26|nr:diaminopropionate ammonia-lyase [Bradyrhizobium sp. NAS80.1]OKO77254.1 diaminopropionate ammonia-lyase [Bradyrhizobium sp. NAS80.1]
MTLLLNRDPQYRTPLDESDRQSLSDEAAAEALAFLSKRDDYVPTPLHELRALADRFGVGAIFVKDESTRLGLGSFKALGGSYAVEKLVLEQASSRLNRSFDARALRDPDVRQIARTITVACATDGNHGRSVAQGAKLTGANAVIFVHAGVSDERERAISRLGARIVRVDGTYDDSVAEASRVSAENGWIVVSDTSWPGYERIPSLVMQGYTVMVGELMDQMPAPPTHIFIQAGVGGIAAALAARFALLLHDRRPFVTVVEPARAACVLQAALSGRAVKIDAGAPTVMAMLECYEASLVAWRILAKVGDAFMTVDENDAIDAMKILASPVAADVPIVAGESGAVGLAALMRAAHDEKMRGALGLGPNSRVLLISTEGATDPDQYAKLTGMSPEQVSMPVRMPFTTT